MLPISRTAAAMNIKAQIALPIIDFPTRKP